MPSFELAAADFRLPGLPFTPKPFITGWNRLEGRTRTEDFSRALKAEARDPLWFLARQWQFLELKGDDAGSPVEARVATRRTKLAALALKGGPAHPFPRDLPLEALVEREQPPLDLVAFIQIARAFDKAMRGASVADGDRELVLAGMQRAFAFDLASVEGVKDEEAQQLAALAGASLFNAARLVGDDGFESTIDAESGLSVALALVAKTATKAARDWWKALYLSPVEPAEDLAWSPSELDYRFRVATAPGSGQLVLEGDGYASGRLDWFSLDVGKSGSRLDLSNANGEAGGNSAGAPLEEALSFLPAAVHVAGMPSHRFWEMEDAKVEFGAISASTTDIAKILLAEFILAFGNDWCVIPYELEIGELCDTLGLVVSDVFGDCTLVRAADRGTDEDWRRWAMFGVETRDSDDWVEPRLFLPPATPKLMESAPIERVVFLRDEMANLVWAAEKTVLSAAGLGVDGEQHALSLAPPPPVEPAPAAGASARYRLGTDSPLNWRPFIPVHKEGSVRSIRLQRARLPGRDPEPLGKILVGPGLSPTSYFVNEEEVPRSGRIVTRSFQRTRWLDGRVVLWLGRRTRTGRGEGSSGVEFDVIEEVPQTS